jgi:hypothetical protein
MVVHVKHSIGISVVGVIDNYIYRRSCRTMHMTQQLRRIGSNVNYGFPQDSDRFRTETVETIIASSARRLESLDSVSYIYSSLEDAGQRPSTLNDLNVQVNLAEIKY